MTHSRIIYSSLFSYFLFSHFIPFPLLPLDIIFPSVPFPSPSFIRSVVVGQSQGAGTWTLFLLLSHLLFVLKFLVHSQSDGERFSESKKIGMDPVPMPIYLSIGTALKVRRS